MTTRLKITTKEQHHGHDVKLIFDNTISDCKYSLNFNTSWILSDGEITQKNIDDFLQAIQSGGKNTLEFSNSGNRGPFVLSINNKKFTVETGVGDGFADSKFSAVLSKSELDQLYSVIKLIK
jgi:hypothetical protein